MAKQKKTQVPHTRQTEQPAPQQPPKAQPTQQPAQPQRPITDIIKGKELYILIATILICCGIVFHDFITGDKLYLYKDIGSDSLNIYFPWLVHISDYFKNSGVPTWSFSQGMGQNVFPSSFSDVFSDIICYCCSKEKLPYMLGFVEIIKILLSGIVAFKYFLELDLDRFAAYIGGFLFAFCGYIILGGCWTIFSVEALYAMLILYGFERLLNHGKILWFVTGICLMSFLQPFFLFPYSIFLALYVPLRFSVVAGDKWSKFPLFVGKTIGLGIVAVAISAYQLFPDILQYLESPRVGGQAGLAGGLKAQPMFGITEPFIRFTTVYRAFGSDMLGTGNDFKGWMNYLEAPLFYCGILCLVAFTHAFVSFNKKQRIAWGIFTTIIALPIFFPYFRYAFWAFSGNYFRAYSLVVTLVLLMLAIQGLSAILKTRKVNLPVLGVTVAFLLFLLYSPSAEFGEGINQGMRSSSTLLILLYGGILYALTTRNLANIATVLLVVFCASEAIFYSSTTVNDRDLLTSKELSEKTGYNDYTIDAVKYIKAHDNGFYRIIKDYQSGPTIHSSFNDQKVQGYFSTTSYHSFNQINYVRFLGGVGALDPKDELQTRWIKGLWERPLLASLTSCKYVLAKNAEPHLKIFGYDSVARFGDVSLFRNNYAEPLGVTYGMGISEQSFRLLSMPIKDLYLFKGCVIDSGDNEVAAAVKPFNLADTAVPTTMDVYFQAAKNLSMKGLNITSFKESHITGEVTTSTPQVLFLSIPYDEGWAATVNGKAARIHRVNLGFCGVILPAGKNVVDLTFTPRYMKQGATLSLIALAVFAGLLFISIKYNSRQTTTA